MERACCTHFWTETFAKQIFNLIKYDGSNRTVTRNFNMYTYTNLLLIFMATGPSCTCCVGVYTEKYPSPFGGLANGGPIDVALQVCRLSGCVGANRIFHMGGIIERQIVLE
jgi:hypothetical protein